MDVLFSFSRPLVVWDKNNKWLPNQAEYNNEKRFLYHYNDEFNKSTQNFTCPN